MVNLLHACDETLTMAILMVSTEILPPQAVSVPRMRAAATEPGYSSKANVT